MGEAAGVDIDTFQAGLVLDQAHEALQPSKGDADQDASALGVGAPSLVLDGRVCSSSSSVRAIAAIETAVAAARGRDTRPRSRGPRRRQPAVGQPGRVAAAGEP